VLPVGHRTAPDGIITSSNAERIAVMALTREEFEELTESFDYNDSDKDGMIEFPEFVNMLNALEANVAEAEARVGFNEIDSDDDGSIDLDEFIEWWNDR
jgi:calmodulin/calcium-binding protein CML/plastin-2